jgi:uracil-DNA glycosylase
VPTKASGPQPCEVLVVGEAPGKDEDALGVPFVGTSGKELRRMLEQSGFDPGSRKPFYPDTKVRFTNVFHERPRDNKIENFCGKRGDVSKSYPYPPLSQGKYILERYLPALDILVDEIRATQPRLIVALGNVPTWALLQRTGITKLRGSVFPNVLVAGGPPVLPTFHPANILREWSNRPIALGDLIKARRFLDTGFSVPRRELWLEPTIAEVREFCSRFILDNPPGVLSFDIETFGETITCIGFAPDDQRAITIPFYDPGKPDRNYWESATDELEAWRICHAVLTSDIPKLGQNGLYDIQYLLRHRIQVKRYLHDTMIRHHSLYPELEKGLGFMATLYTDEAPWKLLRDRKKDTVDKLGDD